MATIADLFNNQKKELYDKELIRIDSRGLINPPRAAALLASSPNTLADLIGGQLAGTIGGSANRPSDTIFKGNTPLSKPITLTAFTQAGLRDAVDGDFGKDGENNGGYVIKQSTGPDSFLNALSKGGSSAAGVATNLAIQGLNKFGSKRGLTKLSDSLKNKSTNKTLGSFTDPEIPLYTNVKPFSKYEYGEMSPEKRQGASAKSWDISNKELLEVQSFEDTKLKDNIKEYRDGNQVSVLFQKYGKSTVIPFSGTISGISEDITPEWSNFKYIGNPFKTYRYQGVERSLKFNLKLYYTTVLQKQTMIKKINYLKSLTFPNDGLSEISYKKSQSQQYAFSPNLIYLTIGDLYNKVFGYMESLSFTIDDNTTWPNIDENTKKDNRDNTLYPSVIDVSIGIKLIENHKPQKDGTTTKYKYDFDGNTYNEDLYKNKAGIKNEPFTITETPKSDDLINGGIFTNT
jgi:hypothetical protein